MKPLAAIGVVAAAILAAHCVSAQPAAPPVVAQKCQSCHGPLGNSVKPEVPRLNGQHADYLQARLKSFLDPGREDPHATAAMWGMVRQVDDATLKSVAGYYAAQTPTEPGPERGALAETGRKFYQSGNPALNVAACQSCHGARGEGHGAMPRLAGQHGVYLTNQLERLRLTLRANDTMHPNANNITDGEIKALVAYLAKD